MYLTINTVKILLLNNNKGEDEDDINLSSLLPSLYCLSCEGCRRTKERGYRLRYCQTYMIRAS